MKRDLEEAIKHLSDKVRDAVAASDRLHVAVGIMCAEVAKPTSLTDAQRADWMDPFLDHLNDNSVVYDIILKVTKKQGSSRFRGTSCVNKRYHQRGKGSIQRTKKDGTRQSI